MANWVLKFISGKYQGGEFPLEEGEEYSIGRSSESSLVLVEDMVSRHHARLFVDNDEVHLNDLGSTNGSFVNGERVKDVILQKGDRILFGTSIIKLVRIEDADHPTERTQRPSGASPAASSSSTTNPSQYTTKATVAGAISGLLEEVSLPDLLQLFSTSRKSGVLRIEGERMALVHLRDGRVIYCEIEGSDMPPEKAAYRVMTWTAGTFVLEPPQEREFDEEIDMSTEALMMEAMRLMDEMDNIRSGMPDPATVLQIRQPLVPPLRSLTPELLDTLQLVVNYGKVETVLNKSLASDLETMQDIGYLLKHNYVEPT